MGLLTSKYQRGPQNDYAAPGLLEIASGQHDCYGCKENTDGADLEGAVDIHVDST